jgi:hypothetical protein
MLAEVDDVSWQPFRTHCRSLLAGLDKLSAPLPTETVKAVKKLLDGEPETPRLAIAAIQKLLDRHCLVGVHINPESRVKAARGPLKAELVHDRARFVLVKVHNEAGVTHALSVSSDQAITAGKKGPNRWIGAAVVNESPFTRTLGGERLEYRVLRLTARQAGKREATLVFDAGQGTQDLGFRAEVPILFTIEKQPLPPPPSPKRRGGERSGSPFPRREGVGGLGEAEDSPHADRF